MYIHICSSVLHNLPSFEVGARRTPNYRDGRCFYGTCKNGCTPPWLLRATYLDGFTWESQNT